MFDAARMNTDAEFYVAEIGSLSQYKFAWAEAEEHNMADAPCCPKCGGFIGMLRWQPPFNLCLKQPRKIGDLTFCFGGAAFIATRRFVDAVCSSAIVGIERTYPVNVVKVGSRGQPPPPEMPELIGVDVVHSSTRIDYETSLVQWDQAPAPEYCRVCGPGGGGRGGILRSISSVTVEADTWDGSDIFFPINLSGTLILSARGHYFFKKYAFTNCTVVPCKDWSISFVGARDN